MTTKVAHPSAACHVCGGTLHFIPRYESLPRVTSDCKVWLAGGKLASCSWCGCVQTSVDDTWKAEVAQIYDRYSIYHQAAGAEQAFFDQASGASRARSSRIFECLQKELRLPPQGRLLDIGCGNGALLRVASAALKGWRLVGTELSDKYGEEVRQIPGVEAHEVGEVEDVSGTFDFVTMVHVLEHVPGPISFLGKLRGKLNPGGLLLIELPNFLQNPFDLMVADHCTHFSLGTLVSVVEKAGYEVVVAADNWVAKELSLVARVGSTASPSSGSAESDFTDTAVEWLWNLSESAGKNGSPAGLFGTSIAATWLAGTAPDAFTCFVDEDRSRVGSDYLNLPVHRPSELPAGSNVFVPLPENFAPSLLARLRSTFADCNFFAGPALLG